MDDLSRRRIAELLTDTLSDEQRQAAMEFEGVRGFAPIGPFSVLLHSPALLNPARALGDHLRYRSTIGPVLSELAILVTAREWTQDFEWFVHASIAAALGIATETIASIRDGARPTTFSGDEALVYDFSIELLQNRNVSDATFARADARFGSAGIVDLTAIHGYYGLLAMLLNVARYDPPGGAMLSRLP